MTAQILHKGSPEKEGVASRSLIILFYTIIGIVVSAAAIWLVASQLITIPGSDNVLVSTRAGVQYPVAPEPIERLIFVILAALTPIALVFYFCFFEFSKVDERVRVASGRIRILLPFIAAIIFVMPFVFSDYINILLFSTEWPAANKTSLFVLALLASAVILLHSQLYRRSGSRTLSVVWWLIVGVAIALQILPYRIASISAVTLAPSWSVHVDAVLYALNQVVHGKTIIADLPSQYGFFPEIIAPLFKVVGLSVLSATIFFACLHATALAAIAALLRRNVHNSFLGMLIFLAMAVPLSLNMYLNGSPQEIYLQYFPIRFFWAAVALLIFSIYATKPGRLLFCVLGFVAGISVFWNLDTGIPVLVSIGATILVKPLVTKRSPLRGIGMAALFGLIAASTIAACFIALRIKAGEPLDFASVLASQKLFYMIGYGMLPMPLSPDPWQVILAIYAAGAIAALSGWKERPDNSIFDVLFCCAILGLGLFTYYQGRSHVQCLILVSWPAIFIVGVLTDLTLRAVRTRNAHPAFVFLTIPVLVFVTLGAYTFISAGKALANMAEQNFATLRVDRDPVVADELQFIRNTLKGRDCLILSQRQALYYAELDLASPLPGAGLSETLLQSDLDKLVTRALTEPLQCIYLGYGPLSITSVNVNDAALMKRFPVISRNPLGTIMLLESDPSQQR